MSKVWVNTLESLSGKVVKVDDILDLSAVEAEVAEGLEVAMSHTDETYDAVFQLTKDGTGFLDREARLVFTGGAAPKITIKPKTTSVSWSYYFQGNKVEVLGDLEYKLLPSDYDKGFYLSLNSEGGLVNTGQYPDFKGTALCVYALYDSSTESFLIEGDERHGADRDTTWHYTNHLDVGMVVRQLGVLDWTANNSAKVGIQLTTTTVADEDLEHTITHSAVGSEPFTQALEGAQSQIKIPTLYLEAEKLTSLDDTGLPWVVSDLKYSKSANGLTAVPDSKYVNYFLAATHCQKFPIKLIAGRQVFDTPEETGTERLDALRLNLPEIALLYRIVLQRDNTATQVGKCKITAVEKASIRKSVAGQSNDAGESLPTHPALLGRNSPNQHTMEAITGLTSALASKASSSHTHNWSQISGKPETATRFPTISEIKGLSAALSNAGQNPDWGNITGKPATATRFPTVQEVTGFQEAVSGLANAFHKHRWEDITNPPETATRFPTVGEVKAALGITGEVTGLYTGLTVDETVYPIGHLIIARTGGHNPSVIKNNVRTALWTPHHERALPLWRGTYEVPAVAVTEKPELRGVAIQGTWALRGYVGDGGSVGTYLFQRIL